MREILFRGKRVDNGEWVNGYYVAANHHWHNRGVHKDWIITAACSNGGWFALHGRQPVVADTVGQYTGLTDKNGRKIFEGDIVEGHCHSAWSHTLQRCVIACGRHGFEARHHIDGLDSEYYTYRVLFSKDVEVIGNIHDTPELLEVGNAAD